MWFSQNLWATIVGENFCMLENVYTEKLPEASSEHRKFRYYGALSLLLVASQCTGSCRELGAF